MTWRVAKSLLHLRQQVDRAFPDRSKDSDGTIGDANHSARASDHNPDADGVVKAMDITHDPENGCDSYKLAEELKNSRDHRIKYIISDRKICSSTQSPWMWRRYNGSNPHDKHVHISVLPDRRHFDDESDWNLPMLKGQPAGIAEVGDEPVKQPFWKRWWKQLAGGSISVGGLGIYDWKVAAIVVGVALIVFLVVWFTFLRDYLKKHEE